MVIGVFFGVNNAYARGQYLDQWETTYLGSSSDDAGCQLCHQSSGGGNGWNQYGWAIRPRFLTHRASNGGDDVAALAQALQEVEDELNQDSVDGLVFLDEIRYNTQPGWVDGSVNQINYNGQPSLSNQPPPTYPIGAMTETDLVVNEVANPGSNSLPDESVLIDLHTVAADFNAPVKAVRAPGINGSLFVVEQRGRVIRVDLTTGIKTQFLNIENQLVPPREGFDERGLLSLAFHPNFASNGLFYTYQSEPVRPAQDNDVDYSTLPNPDHRTMVVEYRASNSSCNSFVSKQKTLLVIDQPQFNHDGGDLAFGPGGHLYISLGDGGSADDQGNGHGLFGNGRDNTNPLGTILRIDPTGSNAGNGKYGIPNDNPFIGMGDSGLDEIFAYGFRNPYRFSFDQQCFAQGQTCNTLIAADVGQNKLEEIDDVVSGGNYGWKWKEGSFFFIDLDASEPFVTTDEPPGVPSTLVDPIAEYGRGIGISITGGYVYRGQAIPALDGHYILADFFRTGSARNLMSLDGPILSEFSADVSGNVTGFGQDAENELYVVTNPTFGDPLNVEGTLQKILPFGAVYSAPDGTDESAQCPPSDDLCVPIKASNGNIAMVCL